MVSTNLVFVHQPKCAGTALKRALSSSYAPERVITLDARRSSETAEWLGKDPLEYRRDLLAYELAHQGLGRMLTGHWAVDEPLVAHFKERYLFVTLLRHPVERWFSHFFYDRYKDGDYRRITGSLEEFLATDRARREGNMYVRMLNAGGRGGSDDVDAACRTLDHFAEVGELETVDSFVSAVGRRLGGTLRLPTRNESPAPLDERLRLMADFRGTVEALCEPDLAVYSYAVNRRVA